MTGALTTHIPEGAYSGADSAQNVYRYNMTEHMLRQYALDNQRDILAVSKGDTAAEKRVIYLSRVNAFCRSRYEFNALIDPTWQTKVRSIEERQTGPEPDKLVA